MTAKVFPLESFAVYGNNKIECFSFKSGHIIGVVQTRLAYSVRVIILVFYNC